MNSFSVPTAIPACVVLVHTDVPRPVIDRIRMADLDAPDLAVLDLRPKRRRAHDAVRTLRATRFNGALVVIGQRDASHERITALEAGADDVLDVQMGEEEFVARIRAVLRRAKSVQHPPMTPMVPGLSLHWGCRTVECNGLRRALTQTEFNLILVMTMNAGRIVLRRHLLLIVWGAASESRARKVLNTYICALRRKLASIGAQHTVQTIRGVGFSLQQHNAGLPE
ncbi:response regulator transcription factor [Rhodococcus sp. ZPP]|uniref:response regulator transcription factor n=1 Tax=Rhodococcus sp. ZPP TaxID=2749906 RepID=UPI001AD85895|nr:response regulator transcription factor [Rhodococcus sp. ZPP]QTJ68038.1 response regulator transcription factor [Rhodococcus sp. ZPP]